MRHHAPNALRSITGTIPLGLAAVIVLAGCASGRTERLAVFDQGRFQKEFVVDLDRKHGFYDEFEVTIDHRLRDGADEYVVGVLDRDSKESHSFYRVFKDPQAHSGFMWKDRDRTIVLESR